MDDFTNEQMFYSGYKNAMLTVKIILDKVLDEIEEEEMNESCSKTLEFAKERIKLAKEVCLEEFLGVEEFLGEDED
jgi:hypothetical protein